MFYNVGIIPRLNQAFGLSTKNSERPVFSNKNDICELKFKGSKVDKTQQEEIDEIWEKNLEDIENINKLIGQSNYRTQREVIPYKDFDCEKIEKQIANCDKKMEPDYPVEAFDGYTQVLRRLNKTLEDLPDRDMPNSDKNCWFEDITYYMNQTLLGMIKWYVSTDRGLHKEPYYLREKLKNGTEAKAFQLEYGECIHPQLLDYISPEETH